MLLQMKDFVFEPFSGSWVVFFQYIPPLLPEGANLEGICLAGYLYQGVPNLSRPGLP